MTNATYRAGIVGLGFIGGADQVSGDALGQRVVDLDGTHFDALSSHPRVNIVAGSSRDAGRRERFAQRTEAAVYADWKEMLVKRGTRRCERSDLCAGSCRNYRCVCRTGDSCHLLRKTDSNAAPGCGTDGCGV